MKVLTRYIILIAIVLPAMAAFGQREPEKAGRLEDGKFILQIDLNWNQQQKEKFAELFDIDSLMLEKIFSKEFSYIIDSTDWVVRNVLPGSLEIMKNLEQPSETWINEIILSEITKISKIPPPSPVPAPANYGINDLVLPAAFQYSDGVACFFLPGYLGAKKVHLSGSFNQWSTMRMAMEKTAEGWKYCVELPPGKHLYKFIVDGRWMPDPNNKNRESDGHRGYNSVIFCYNHVFELQGYSNARRVILAGSFNYWNTRELRMEKTSDGWKLPLFLREGTHAYKFIVDGNWILDPSNPVTRPDGRGNINSFIGIGDEHIFRLRGFEDAGQVLLAGNFNAWNTGELFMEKHGDEWRLPYVLAAGIYEYKFIVDGLWIIDPTNPFVTGKGDFKNSVLVFKPNHIFQLRGFADAKSVIVTGSFNGWSHDNYQMLHRDGEWIFPAYLNPGRHSYKFIVDGNWILDPDNPLWEENEFGTGNSVLWVE